MTSELFCCCCCCYHLFISLQTSAVLSSPRTVNGNHGDLALRSNDIPIITNGDGDDLSSEEEDPLGKISYY